MREFFARHHPTEQPSVCTCGVFEQIGLVHCSARTRETDCIPRAQERLRKMAKQDHLDALKAKRRFPGAPFPRAIAGWCKWCGEDILLPDGERDFRRGWHRACLDEFFLHTRRDNQLPYLLERDGMGCRSCGAPAGAWHGYWTCIDAERAADWWARATWVHDDMPAPPDGPFTLVRWASALEVDHVIALALVAHLPDAERRHYFGPGNLQLLCSDCHKAKTKSDTRAIRALQRELSQGEPP